MVLRAAAATVLQILAAAEPVVEAAPRPEPAAALASLEAEQADLFARVAPSVVLLVSEGTSGSGFVVGGDGLVLTNAHVVGEAEEVAVQLLDGRYGRGQVIARASGSLDLALVRIPFADLPPLEAGEPDAVRAGTFAATVGHGGGAAWTFSTGLVANPRPLGDGAPLVLAQMALRPGSSGGPLVDRRGRAVAVVTAGTKNASGVTFAIRIDAAARAFPQLAGWLSAPPPAVAAGGASAGVPAAPPVVESVAVAAAEPVRPVSVARFSAPSTAPGGWDPSLASTPVALVTVWEASPPKARRPPLVAAGPGAIGPPVAAHGGDTGSAEAPPPASSPAPAGGPTAARLVAGLLAAIGLAGWLRTSARRRRP